MFGYWLLCVTANSDSQSDEPEYWYLLELWLYSNELKMTNTPKVPLPQGPEKNTGWVSVFVIPAGQPQIFGGTTEATEIRAHRDIKKEKKWSPEVSVRGNQRP